MADLDFSLTVERRPNIIIPLVERKPDFVNYISLEEKNKLASIAASAEVNVQPDWNETDVADDDFIKNKPDYSLFRMIIRDNFLGDVDGVNKDFYTTRDILEGSELIYVNGVLQVPEVDYVVVDSSCISFTEPPRIDEGYADRLVFNYYPADSLLIATVPISGATIGTDFIVA